MQSKYILKSSRFLSNASAEGQIMVHNGRPYCWTCRRPKRTCFCEQWKPFHTTKVRFCLLMHSEEAKQRTGTGWMTHLFLHNSDLFIGVDFSQNERIRALLTDPSFAPMILYPSPRATPLAEVVTRSKEQIPLLFVLDGTWRTVRRILAMNPDLRALPSVSFVTPRQSRFRFKKQPKEYCLSTIEAVDECLAILEPENTERIRLMQAFDSFVEKQLSFIHNSDH